MHSKVACDHNDHDHYADDVKDIHCFTPIKINLRCSTALVGIQQLQRLRPKSEQKCSPGVRSGELINFKRNGYWYKNIHARPLHVVG
jgi:hypothetical protein